MVRDKPRGNYANMVWCVLEFSYFPEVFHAYYCRRMQKNKHTDNPPKIRKKKYNTHDSK